jgi:hypothetical protein
MATLRVTSDGDPYPVKAGVPLVNNGDVRSFTDGSFINDQVHDFTFKYRAGSNTIDPEAVSLTSPIGITTNGVVIYTSASSSDTLPVSATAAPSNFTWNTVDNPTEFRVDACGGRPETGGEYRYRSGAFYKNGMQSNAQYIASTTYLSGTAFGVDNTRHADGHSKILGFAFDGYPIYGPYGYTSATEVGSASNPAVRMTSSYRTKTLEAGGRTFPYSEFPAGSFIEDYEYVTGLGSLDEYNGRFCKTPDYGTGTYAYFLTFSDSGLNNPAYPYIIGPSTREQSSV